MYTEYCAHQTYMVTNNDLNDLKKSKCGKQQFITIICREKRKRERASISQNSALFACSVLFYFIIV